MPVLLLAQGDSQAKDLLRAAIDVRYGVRPPSLETLRVDARGRALVKVGPLASWLPIAARVYLKFPLQFHWAYVLRPAGLPVRQAADAYDGTQLRHREGKNAPQLVADSRVIDSARKRAWAMSAVLLMPLTEQHVSLHARGSHALEAKNTETGDTVTLFFTESRVLSHAQAECYNPHTGKDEVFKIHVEPGSKNKNVNDMILPDKLRLSWDDQPYVEVEPVAAEINPQIPQGLFALPASQ